MGSGNTGVHGATATASELVVMASQVLNRPESSMLRAAFAHTAGEVVRTQGDLPVLKAIELAPDLAVAQTIRAAAEASCEAVSLGGQGTERCARLFSVPIVVRFAEPTTTQEFDVTLTSAIWSAPFLARLNECGARQSISCILPHVYLFEDLANLSLRSVHHGALTASVASVRSNAGTIMPFHVTTPAQRRSGTFLRYLVGYQVKSDPTLRTPAEVRSRFCDCVRSVVHAHIPDASDVVAIYSENFFEPIWKGLWIYHTHRLAEVVRTIAAESPQSSISASITMAGNRNKMEAQLAFYRRERAAQYHAYSVPIRPLEDPNISARRIATELRGLGVTPLIRTSTLQTHRSKRDSFDIGRVKWRGLDRIGLTLPL
jgi:hypothetical protein